MRYTTITLQSTNPAPSGAVEFTFEPTRRFVHAAGQAALLIVAGGGGKPFTLSSDDRSSLISIATTLTSGSRFKQALAGMRPGDRAHLVGPVGAPVAVDEDAPLIALAQGIGITPFLALARSRTLTATTLMQVGAPHYFDEVAAAVTSAERHAHRADLQHALARMVDRGSGARWSISGSGEFTTAIAKQLATAGVPARRIHRDAFWGMRAHSTAGPLSPVTA